MFDLRLATPADLPALHVLIEASVRELSLGFYAPEQIESALVHVFGPDTRLIADGTYYVVSAADEVVAAGGWSRRRTLYGGDPFEGADEDALLDPAREPAKLRAFFVHPAWARRGLARRIFARCAAEARAAGFEGLELMATLPGEPFYRALGFEEVERTEAEIPSGARLPIVRMSLALTA